MNRANLEKLAAYLEALPADYEHFAMRSFFDLGTVTIYSAYGTPLATECGAVACAVAHGPAAGIPPIRLGDEEFSWDEDWFEYSDRVFELTDPEWAWCFCGSWSSIDNTPHGAAKRIRYMLEHGLPEDSDEQSWGDAPYIFAEVK